MKIAALQGKRCRCRHLVHLMNCTTCDVCFNVSLQGCSSRMKGAFSRRIDLEPTSVFLLLSRHRWSNVHPSCSSLRHIRDHRHGFLKTIVSKKKFEESQRSAQSASAGNNESPEGAQGHRETVWNWRSHPNRKKIGGEKQVAHPCDPPLRIFQRHGRGAHRVERKTGKRSWRILNRSEWSFCCPITRRCKWKPRGCRAWKTSWQDARRTRTGMQRGMCS